MALGITASNGGSGDSKPHVKYDARAGRMFRVDRAQGAGGEWSSTPVDITREATFVADMANIRVGWLAFPKGMAPQKRLVTVGQPLPERPTDLDARGKPAFRQGFELDILLHQSCAGAGENVVRELTSNAGCVIEGMDALHSQYLAAPEAAQGKVPVVKLQDTVAVKSGDSTNYRPVFAIVGWVDRPAKMNGTSHAPAPVQQQAAPVASPPPVSPPPAPVVPAAATAPIDLNFG